MPSSAVIYQGPDAVPAGAWRTAGSRPRRSRWAPVPATVIEVVSGVAEGEEVVSRAGTFVADGDLVTPVRNDTTGAIGQMNWNFSAWSIRNPVPPILLFIVLIALGLMSFFKLPITRFPQHRRPVWST